MVRKDTNRQYSLRKLKKGTASVAVALSALGAGLTVNQTEVSAAPPITRNAAKNADELRKRFEASDLENHKLKFDND
ncbi:TPA: YSIRK-type signal peptide-containing protein, partial [Streptococcus pyogenes]